MANDFKKIICPSCKAEISLDEAFVHQFEEAARKQLAAEQKTKDAEFQLRERGIVEREKTIGKTIAEQAEKARLTAERDAREKVAKEKAAEVKFLTDQLKEKDKSLEEARALELKARQDKVRFEDEKKAFELEKQRQLDAEREHIRSEAQKKAEEEMHLKMMEKDKQLDDARKANMDLQRKLQQGSQQTQGEVLELELEEMLRSAFPFDKIEPVAKGVKGADVIQYVVSPAGKDCGSIIWEAKHTKAWSEPWIQKLKEDQRKMNAEIAVIASDVLPKETRDFVFRDGIWIADYKLSIPLAMTLRDQLIKVGVVKQASIGKNEKLEVLYTYLSSTEFRHKIEAIVEAFQGMRVDLEKEKLLLTKVWAKREKQIQQVTLNTIGMYGDLEGLMGAAIQPIQALEAPDEIEEEDE